MPQKRKKSAVQMKQDRHNIGICWSCVGTYNFLSSSLTWCQFKIPRIKHSLNIDYISYVERTQKNCIWAD